ncbi:microtubule cross-linking factor 1 isoform X3 [Scleropages formosus]|uniref:microtubule cross-linking factor 1 isoform X3 n=1 Tax=Scleropages formosus TaxID=113540 RepID=UPI0010FA6BC1|nr:microtubule cross-linking factor 1 isoform X3 [Scleropages formosus]
MESPHGPHGDVQQQSILLEKKRVNRAPSPARPFLKDAHLKDARSRASASKPPAVAPKSPKLSGKQPPSPGLVAAQSRASRRGVPGAREKAAAAGKSAAKSAVTKKAARLAQHGSAEQTFTCRQVDPAPVGAKSKKGKLCSVARGALGLDSPVRVPAGSGLARVAHTDSSSDLSDCLSEPLSDEQRRAPAASSDAESASGSGSGSSELAGCARHPDAPGQRTTARGAEEPLERGRVAGNPGRPATCDEREPRGGRRGTREEELLREIEDLRSENDYLKDEVDELRAEMEELRDSYLEEEVYQLQELRRELDRANKNCRILQYRLRKAEQKSLRAAQTGQVDGELVRNLEQDLKVAKDVSVRLHNELESVEDKRIRAEDENELLREKIIEVEISKQALHNELERAKESSLRRRGSREAFKERKSPSHLGGQEDSADLRCQLQFAKEESALMRKKMAKLSREKDELEQELQKYKSVYGDVDSPLPMGECAGGGPHSTREAELRLRLKLVEEEANILGRKIVELEVENRGLRAENEEIRCQYERDCPGRELLSSAPTSPFGDGLESGAELRRHLQFVEEEAALLRRSIAEIEDHNRQLTSELSRIRLGPGPEEDGASRSGTGGDGHAGTGLLQEELKAARMQINELSGKVMKLQYENRVLISNMQRCDLAAHLGLRTASPRDSDAESDAGRREGEDEDASRLLNLHPKREGPVGGESDSEELVEKTSGFGSGKPSDGSELSRHRREEPETLARVRREAERLGKMVDRLIADTESLVYDGKLVVTGAEALETELQGGHDSEETKPEPPGLDAVSARMRAFRTELHIFMEKIDHLGEGLHEHVDDLSPMPNLTESSSFLSGVTSMSRDSPIGTMGRDLITDFQPAPPHTGLRDELEWCLGQEGAPEPETQRGQQGTDQSRGARGHSKYGRPEGLSAELRDAAVPEASAQVREIPARLEQERRLRQEELEVLSTRAAQLEDERRRAQGDPRRSLQDQPWVQERTLLQQELRLLRHNMAAVYVKLRWLLVNWRLGRRGDVEGEGARAQADASDSIPELGLLMDPVEGAAEKEDGSTVPVGGVGDGAEPRLSLQTPELLQHQKQADENRRVLHALRTLLEELRSELRDEEQRRCQLQQAYANEKAGWEVQWAELRCRAQQLEEGVGEAAPGGDPERSDPRGAFAREREEHRRLLAESHNAALDLRWRLQHGEKRWGRERTELLERFDRERQDWDWHMRELHRKAEKLQRELSTPSEGKDAAHRAYSPQDSPRAPRSPRSPRATAPTLSAPAARSYSDSEATLEDRPAMRLKGSESFRPTENLFLDALSLDPLSESAVPPPSRLESEKRFPCLNEVIENLNEISDRKGLEAFHEEEISGGNLLRAKSVCSMSEFQRLMDSSPFLPDKNGRGSAGREEATPPLSPDDLKYIEEYNSKGWDFPPAEAPAEAWPERSEVRRAEQTCEQPFQPTSWFLTTSATLTTSTLSSPEHCQRQPLRGATAPERYGVRVLHSPPFSIKLDGSGPPVGSERSAAEPEFVFSVTKARGSEPSTGAEEVLGRWPRDLPKHHRELLEGGLRHADRPVCSTVAFGSSLELELSRNLSDDMKEVAFSVRNAIRSSPVDRQLKDTACQTNGFTTRGTQTTQTISVGLQTEALRNITSSPHRCLTPKGGSTPISSPSRSLRKVQYSPVVQTKFERPCCSPKYGSPKLQRKPSSGKVEQPNNRAPTPTTPQKGYSESAWARSTTTRDSPVHTTINDGLSSLFNIIDHTPVVYDTLQKFTKSPSRSRPADSGSAEPRSSGLGVVQEFLRNVRGRSPSPVQLVVETQGEKTPEVVSIRQDLSAPPGYTLAENAARLLNKRLMEQAVKEEKRLSSSSQSSLSKEGRPGDGDKSQQGPIEMTAPSWESARGSFRRRGQRSLNECRLFLNIRPPQTRTTQSYYLHPGDSNTLLVPMLSCPVLRSPRP